MKKKERELRKILRMMERGEQPNFLQVMQALNSVPDIVTLSKRPPAGKENITLCELNGRACCD